MSDQRIIIAQRIRVCHKANSTVLYNPQTFERLEVNANAGILVRLLQGGAKTPFDLAKSFAMQNSVPKDQICGLTERITGLLESLSDKGFLVQKTPGT